MWRKRSPIFRYTVYGALFGLAFPVLSTLADLYMQQLPLTLDSVLQVQGSTVLHWVIDTAPFFLAVWVHDNMRLKSKAVLFFSLLAVNVILWIVFVNVLGWM